MRRKTTFAAWLSTFLFCFLFWFLLTWSLALRELILGVFFSALVAVFTAKFLIHSKAFHFFNPARLLALVAYGLVLLREIIKANCHMARIVLSGRRKNCRSGVIRIPGAKGFHCEYGLAMVSNGITLTPGTITMDVAEDEEGNDYYYVHWLEVVETDREKAGDIIKGNLEKWSRRVWK